MDQDIFTTGDKAASTKKEVQVVSKQENAEDAAEQRWARAR